MSAFKVKETPEHFLLNCKEFENERNEPENNVRKISYQNSKSRPYITLEDLLGECDLPTEGSVKIRILLEEFLLKIQKEI